mmetsp:Transcript_2102/g.5351  ORF Transcript_2102/g.5351 Transcript_2102/m.5351 type:complete len:931 (+) Transcript_2102:94-2886(+)|eukprot:CAMPEP_0202367838 /NCGR_PEP_ID=MMETSP1127-20130417/99_1 /ASSEMBLY_ACC=CAM_ASM_000462 /TAXON_ID=3047 /ORGANISM="Dunaliella tertiolecta, Strain CCMP1320" /LENGTH=930 /DNA_ID=CAMNT_0048963155 /DNA_START=70 /DNA_END=2862 /DNA_ORIENTATION=+
MAEEQSSIQVCVRARPLNPRERNEGHRECVSFDEPTKQVVVTAVDKNTLLQLRGKTALGYAFDRRYGPECTSDSIYDDRVHALVESCFKGYNATVLAYGQTGSGKTHTMSGGQGIHGVVEEGITPRVIRHLFQIVDNIKKKQKPGEKIEVTACALELYNEDLLDLSVRSGREELASKNGWDTIRATMGLKLQERPVGKDGRVVPEVVGAHERKVTSAKELAKFYNDCMINRSTGSTKLNDRSSRSHAIFTINIHRTTVEVLEEVGNDMKAKVRTSDYTSKLHLVDLAGSERVKRSGATGKELKEACNINGGLLALGNVIVALATESEAKKESKKGHIPYRDSKLTRLLQDSLGGNSLTVLISCISPSEMDFEETNNTLKYANRACLIKNTPLPNNYASVEEDLLPSIPMGGAAGGLGMMQLQALLEDHGRQKELRERREREKREKELRRLADLEAARSEDSKRPGYQRLRAQQYYEDLRKQLAAGKTSIPTSQVIGDENLKGFGSGRHRFADLNLSVDGLPPLTPGSNDRGSARSRIQLMRASTSRTPSSGSKRYGSLTQSQSLQRGVNSSQNFDWTPQAGPENDFFEQESPQAQAGSGSFLEDEQASRNQADNGDAGDDQEAAAKQAAISKSKFRRGQGAQKEAATPEKEAEPEPQGDVEAQTPITDNNNEDFDYIPDDSMPKLLARFRVNTNDTLAVYKAISKEDFQDVIGLLPENTPLPASEKMTYLLARLELNPNKDLNATLQRVVNRETTMNEAVGPAVGCLMATFGTNMISSCIFDFEDPEDLKYYDVEERIELWGLQIPHTSARPPLEAVAAAETEAGKENNQGPEVTPWTSIDRLNMSIGLLFALCTHALDNGIRCGFCVPRPQLLKRWLQAGVRMRQIQSELKLIYPPSAHDYEYYKASTVAYFMVNEVRDGLEERLALVS